jgi:hypothetical protein
MINCLIEWLSWPRARAHKGRNLFTIDIARADNLLQSTICKHIHLLQRYIAENKDGTTIDDGFDDDGSDFVTSEIHLVSSHLPQSNNAAHDTLTLTNTIKEKLWKLGKQVELCTNKEALQQLDKQLNTAQHLFSSLQKQVSHHKLQPISNTPSNKKIQKQNRFRSTKKVKKPTSRPRFEKPTTKKSQSLLVPCSDGRCMVSQVFRCKTWRNKARHDVTLEHME